MRRTFRRPKPKPQIEFYRTNEQIRVPEVRVIDDAGGMLGIMPVAKAIALAREQELDLVEVFPKAQPPVAKITDYGRMRYQKEKQLQKQKAKQKKIEVKDIRLSLRISPHDLDLRLQQAIKFLERGDKLKIEIILKGREKQLSGKGVEIIKNFVNKLKDANGLKVAEEQGLTRQMNSFNMIVINKKG
ncbi:translation initiation factor IF-3 [Candidatus Falkowbacteria bacterium RIFCSPLOWO2_12_FULL_45_10]|uniref:Translation initiation factor IF-3 n=3 Tax=Candidatus Falkowiibacteriota TaxID=1752728 RepID=A0A1F5RVV9_9BACT|nr:MAG: translation initiation factor IF-3 [Candidatus Falkowbacteria bacterium RIFCSPHIGHO2_02_FULL_45_15]OGF18811.1 MAG: translation initiation factor IF-3 [Candidatus Falkowbacteria bacterium RIFCSPLOWO2_02_FULL_45_15]OGF19236.1 MAG: translation initiation factor IF-3 [Candidatus Falkowbacteria bacterium RIFCSPLOWO2_12_FULL_45_10]